MEIASARQRLTGQWPEPSPMRPAPPPATEVGTTGSTKYSTVGVERSVRPSETIRRVLPLLERMGVTRVGEVTHLDRIGLPNFVAVRPREAGRGISYYNGKGATRAQARASALMEAVERVSAEACSLPVIRASFRQLRLTAPAVAPCELLAPRILGSLEDVRLEWVLGQDAIGGGACYVPLNAVVTPYRPVGAEAAWDSSTNGLASGNTRDEALCQALCEVIERDAMSLHHATVRLRGGVNAILEGLGVSATRPSPPSHPLIDPATLPSRPARLLKRLRAPGSGSTSATSRRTSASRRSIAPWPSLAEAGVTPSTAAMAAIPTPAWRRFAP